MVARGVPFRAVSEQNSWAPPLCAAAVAAERGVDVRVIDLFKGAGGFSKGAAELTDDIVGYELDDDACATSRAAGFGVVQVNLANIDPWDIARRDFHLHLHASPPCTTFSAAGRGHGRKFIDDLCVAVRDILAGDDWDDVIAGLPDDIDDTSKLVLVPARWISALEPDTISMEQVRAVLPIWDAYAEALELIDGYSAWTALLSAEQYGLPQTRIRAWLGASRDRPCEPPPPTHSKYHNRNPTKLDEGVLPWVSMAEALVEYRARDLIDATERPALALTEKARSMDVFTDQGMDEADWTRRRPATTVMGDPRIWPPGHKVNQADRDRDPNADERYGDRAGKRARKISIEEAAILQGFPADYPFQGTKTSKFRQVGNAVPPPVAEVVLRSLTETREDEPSTNR